MWISAWLRQLRGSPSGSSCIFLTASAYFEKNGSDGSSDWTSRRIRGVAALAPLRKKGAAAAVVAPAINVRRSMVFDPCRMSFLEVGSHSVQGPGFLLRRRSPWGLDASAPVGGGDSRLPHRPGRSPPRLEPRLRRSISCETNSRGSCMSSLHHPVMKPIRPTTELHDPLVGA
jgi:hypothetical protein